MGPDNEAFYSWPCGWPHHLYLPRGKAGTRQLFKERTVERVKRLCKRRCGCRHLNKEFFSPWLIQLGGWVCISIETIGGHSVWYPWWTISAYGGYWNLRCWLNRAESDIMPDIGLNFLPISDNRHLNPTNKLLLFFFTFQQSPHLRSLASQNISQSEFLQIIWL